MLSTGLSTNQVYHIRVYKLIRMFKKLFKKTYKLSRITKRKKT